MQQRKSLRLFRRWLVVIGILLGFFVGATAKVWTPEEVPVPRYHDRTQYVSNPEYILSQTTVDSLNVILQNLEETKGVQTLVVVLDKLEGNDPYEFAMALARKHGVGNKANTGLVIVLAVGDRSYQFLTGEGLEGTLPDGQIQLIEDRYFVPLLKKQEWDDAMLVAVKAIDLVIQGDTELTALEDSGNVVCIFSISQIQDAHNVTNEKFRSSVSKNSDLIEMVESYALLSAPIDANTVDKSSLVNEQKMMIKMIPLAQVFLQAWF